MTQWYACDYHGVFAREPGLTECPLDIHIPDGDVEWVGGCRRKLYQINFDAHEDDPDRLTMP